MYVLLVLLMGAIFAGSAARSQKIEFNHGFQILAKSLRQYLNEQPKEVTLTEGVHLVSIGQVNNGRSVAAEDNIVSALEDYVQNHELRIRLPELIPSHGFSKYFKSALTELEDKRSGEETARKKKGGGGAGFLLMGLLFAKTLGAIGLGGVGLLALKALTVAALALMLSAIIGLKKLVHSGGDEGGHTVIHAGHGGGHEYRRKREAANSAYRAWKSFYNSEIK